MLSWYDLVQTIGNPVSAYRVCIQDYRRSRYGWYGIFSRCCCYQNLHLPIIYVTLSKTTTMCSEASSSMLHLRVYKMAVGIPYLDGCRVYKKSLYSFVSQLFELGQVFTSHLLNLLAVVVRHKQLWAISLCFEDFDELLSSFFLLQVRNETYVDCPRPSFSLLTRTMGPLHSTRGRPRRPGALQQIQHNSHSPSPRARPR